MLIISPQATHCIKIKYFDRQAWETSVDPDQMPQNVASDQDLHCLPLNQQFFRHINLLEF